MYNYSNGTLTSTSRGMSYNYDANGEPRIQIVTSTSWAYSWNTQSNLLRVSRGGTTQVAYAYDCFGLNNELTSSLASGVTTRYAYDSNGDLISKTSGNTQLAFSWSPAGNLVSATNNTVARGLYAYNGLGRRVESVEGGNTLFYGYLGTETLAELRSGLENNYVFAARLRISHYGSNPTGFYHTDPLGSTRMVTDQNRNIVFSDNYQPYGQDNLVSGSETYRFTGKPVSQTTGLYYYYHRWYDPAIGRFVSLDPKHGHLSNPQSLNPYVYVGDSPTSATDPSGMDGGLGVDNRCEKLHQCSSAGPDPLFTAVSNFINNNIVTPIVNKVVKPLINNVVVPLVNNVVIPYLKDEYNGLVATYNTLSNVGSQIWNGYQTFTNTIHNEQQSLYRSVNQDLQGFAHDITHLRLTNPTQFLFGMLACAGTFAVVAGLVLAPEAAPLEIGAEEVATEGALVGAASAAGWAHGAAETGTLILGLGAACVTLTAGSFSEQ